jgi:hypothetical protein
MSFDLVQIRKLAQEKEDENWRFRTFLKGQCHLKSDEVDRRVFADHSARVGRNRLHFLRQLLPAGEAVVQ